MTEYEEAIHLAKRVLDHCDQGEDPDSDLAILSRQFLRANERNSLTIKTLKWLMFCARTAGGVAGCDLELCTACDEAEACVIGAGQTPEQLPQYLIEEIGCGADPEDIRQRYYASERRKSNPFIHTENCPSHDGDECTCR